jgi:hypothetical protein
MENPEKPGKAFAGRTVEGFSRDKCLAAVTFFWSRKCIRNEWKLEEMGN